MKQLSSTAPAYTSLAPKLQASPCLRSDQRHPRPLVPSFALLTLTAAAFAAPSRHVRTRTHSPAHPAVLCTDIPADLRPSSRSSTSHAARSNGNPFRRRPSRPPAPAPAATDDCAGKQRWRPDNTSSAAMQRYSDFGNTAAPATIAQQRHRSSSTSGATNSDPLAGRRLQVRSGAQQRLDLPAAP